MNTRILIVGCIMACVPCPNALALKEFKKVFENRYVKPLDKSAQRVFRKANCNVCHVKGEKKTVNNAYGDEIAQRIPGDAKQRLKQAKEAGTRDQELEQLLLELAAALGQTELLPGPDGQTFGDRLKSGKLPIESAATAADEHDVNQEGVGETDATDEVSVDEAKVKTDSGSGDRNTKMSM